MEVIPIPTRVAEATTTTENFTEDGYGRQGARLQEDVEGRIGGCGLA